MISATIIADSISLDSKRLTTLEVTFHRFILAEFNTYRKFSRNAASSRAIPLQRRIDEVVTNPALPVKWGKNQPGMVASEDLDEESEYEARMTWLEAADAAADYARCLSMLGLHKQVAARVLEPFLWHTSVVSSTDYQNMFKQRIHPDAQPEFQALAVKMKEAYDASEPVTLSYGEWHLPYVSDEEKSEFDLDQQKQLSVARVAKTSYLNQGKVDIDKDFALYDRLINSEPIHYSPLEHIATPRASVTQGNFDGWLQLRHDL